MTEREKFEAWYLSLHGSTIDDLHTEPDGDLHMAKGDYYDLGARMMWQAWQARQPEIDKMKEWESDADTLACIRLYFLTVERVGTWYRIRQAEKPDELAYEQSLTVAVKKAVETLQEQK